VNRIVHPAPAVPHPPDDAPVFPADAVEVGRILGAWGVKGGIKVQPFAADPQALFSSRRWFLRPPERPRPAAASALPAVLRVRGVREQGDAIVATCSEVEDRDAAERLKGARVFIARSSFPTAGADEFYWVDLIGLRVLNREGVDLGVVSGLLETGPHCVLCVAPRGEGAGEILIPFVDAYVDRVDTEAGVIRADWHLDWQAGL
jgi:16S rRNA processing protein RimM